MIGEVLAFAGACFVLIAAIGVVRFDHSLALLHSLS